MIAGFILFVIPQTVFADSSWIWLTDYRPFDRRKMSLIDAEMTNLNNRLRYCNAEENMRDNRKKELQLLKNRLKHGVVLEKFDRRC